MSYRNDDHGGSGYGPRAGWEGGAGGYGHGGRATSWHRTLDRTLDWLRARPGESWAFFAAGVLLALLIG